MRPPSPRLRALPPWPRVSCIVTASDHTNHLRSAIDSALAQDYPADRLEIVVVDDDSTDGLAAVLADYGDRVRTARPQDDGINAATTSGMQTATGELLTFLDADDLWRPDRTGLLVDALRAAPRAAISYGGMEMIDDAGATVAASCRQSMGLPAPSGRVFDRLFVENFVSAGAMMVRAELASSFSPIPPHAAQYDWWIASQIARVAELTAIAQPVNRHRHHDASPSLGGHGEHVTRRYENEIGFRRWLLETAEPDLVGLSQLLAAVQSLDIAIEHVAGVHGSDTAARLGLGLEDRQHAVAAMHDASAMLDDGRIAGALLRLVAAIGHDPLWDQPRDLVIQLAPHVEARAAETAVRGAPRRASSRGVREVVLAVDYFHPWVGGSERLAEGLGTALTAHGYSVRIATRRLPERRDTHRLGMPIHEVTDVADYDRALAGADALIALSDPRGWPIAAWPALAELPGCVIAVPCINAQNHALLVGTPSELAAYRARLLLADVVVHSSLNGFDAALLGQLGMPGVYVPNAVDRVAPQRGLRERLGIDPEAVLVLAVGNLWPEKNHLGLLEALAPLPEEWELVIVGAPAPPYPELAEQIAIRAAGLDRVHLVGGLAPDEVSGAMAEATVLALPSVAEATPLVLIEAMSHGLPWLATPACGSAADHAGGLVLEVDDFRGAIERLAGDPDAYAALADASRRHWAAAYCWDAVAPRYAALLEGRDPGPLHAPPGAREATAAVAATLGRLPASA